MEHIPAMAKHAYTPALRAGNTRHELEAAIAAAIDLLDAMDGDPDNEPDHDGEAEPDEASATAWGC